MIREHQSSSPVGEPSVGECVFVYGTLRRGERANYILEGQSEYVQDDSIRGAEMYNLGSFPGVVLKEGSDGIVTGQLYRITNEELPHRLDQYEGYPYLYDRRLLETVSGEKAWIYLYNHPVVNSDRIEDGDWVAHKDRQHKVEYMR